MKNKLYIILPVAAFLLIFTNAFFGHLIFDYDSEQSINKYSVYIHLQPEWKSYPRNIIFDITTTWSNPESGKNDPYYEPELDVNLKTEYNPNEIQYIHGKSYVELRHEFSDCKNEWKPVLYRRAVDAFRSQIDYLTGLQLNPDPYTVIYPNILNEKYDLSEQEDKLESGYMQFIPICTAKNSTSYDYSVRIDDQNIGFDVYFVSQDSGDISNTNYRHYTSDGCFGTNYQSFSGTCNNVSKNSGLLIAIPDELSKSLTKITVSLHEKI